MAPTEIDGLEGSAELGEEGVEDMIVLNDLKEGTILRNLQIRYGRESIYTYIGSILVAVNPYKMFNIYGLNMVKKYESQVLGTQPPHLFAIGSAAYSKMIKDNQNQVVVISGESGAGKTESTKLLMQYLAAVNRARSNIVTEQILEASPLLEAFGNAKTIRNDNSSRFGKFVEVHFKNGQIKGAKTSEYLLEKSRIVKQSEDERNYHVFYEMLAGLPPEEKEKYGLKAANKYFYLNQGGSCSIEGKSDRDDFKALQSALEVLDFDKDEQQTIFQMLASVLHLGNIYFEKKQIDGQEAVEIGDDNEVKWVSHLLKISTNWLKESATMKATMARGDRILSPIGIDQALDSRDAIAKALYSTLFSWLVKRINQIVNKTEQRSTSIAILDIFGFEDFVQNSFEQLCINYANETLQFYFNRHIFRIEQQEYGKEQIDWKEITFKDNQAVLDLISKRPIGIIHILDDESNFPRSTDKSFLEKCNYTHIDNPLYDKPRLSSPVFVIEHYAGRVTYNVENFIEKNKDTLRNDVMELLTSSKNKMISQMFRDLRDKYISKTVNKNTGRFITMKPRTPTVGASFNESLVNLIDTMTRCHPHFIRCVKPNSEKAPMKFDVPVIMAQLRYTGMLETIRIRRMGYPVRMSFKNFDSRYHCLVKDRFLRTMSYKQKSEMILEKVNGKHMEEYQIGMSKIFMREAFSQNLEQKRYQVMTAAVLILQMAAQGYIARKNFRRIRIACIILQAHVRGWRGRRRYLKAKRGITILQSYVRMRKVRQTFIKKREEMRKKFEAERRKKEAAERERNARAVAGVAHLEIPPELAFIFSKLDDWQPIHMANHIIPVVGPVQQKDYNYVLPEDLYSYIFTKYTTAYFKNNSWGMLKEAIRSPFLVMNDELDTKDSIAIFKLILRFMNDVNLSGKKENVLADYIVQKGLSHPVLRDEIYSQICNQTWRNINPANVERGWLLMANCLSCFPPSQTLYKYLLKYVSDQAYNGYKQVCQHKLLQCAYIESVLSRTYPPCMLEWKANRKRANMALEARFPDGKLETSHAESWMTGEEFARHLLHQRNILEGSHGWTVGLHDGSNLYELAGYDYIFDLVSEMEIPPAFPVCKSFFLVSSDKTRSGRNKELFEHSPHNPERHNVMDPPLEELKDPIPMTPPTPPPSPKPQKDLGLSQTSALNRRPTGQVGRSPGLSKSSSLNARYISGSQNKHHIPPKDNVNRHSTIQEESDEPDGGMMASRALPPLPVAPPPVGAPPPPPPPPIVAPAPAPLIQPAAPKPKLTPGPMSLQVSQDILTLARSRLNSRYADEDTSEVTSVVRKTSVAREITDLYGKVKVAPPAMKSPSPPATPQPVYDTRPPSAQPVYDVRPPPAQPVYDVRPPSAQPVYDTRPPPAQPVYDVRPPPAQSVYDVRPPPAQLVYDVRPPPAQPVYDVRPPSAQPIYDTQPPPTLPSHNPPKLTYNVQNPMERRDTGPPHISSQVPPVPAHGRPVPMNQQLHVETAPSESDSTQVRSLRESMQRYSERPSQASSVVSGHIMNGHHLLPPGGSRAAQRGRLPNGSIASDLDENQNQLGLGGSKLNKRYAKTGHTPESRAVGSSAVGMIRRKNLGSSDALSQVSGGASNASNQLDLDNWISGMFDHALDGEVDEMSDIRSVGRVIRGGMKSPGVPSIPEVGRGRARSRTQSVATEEMDDWLDDMFDIDENVDRLGKASSVANALKGGGDNQGATQTQTQPLQTGLGPNLATMQGMNLDGSLLSSSFNPGLGLSFGYNPLLTTFPGAGLQPDITQQLLAQQMAAQQLAAQQQAAQRQAALNAQQVNLQASLQQATLQNQLLQQTIQQEVLKQQLAQMQSQSAGPSQPATDSPSTSVPLSSSPIVKSPPPTSKKPDFRPNRFQKQPQSKHNYSITGRSMSTTSPTKSADKTDKEVHFSEPDIAEEESILPIPVDLSELNDQGASPKLVKRCAPSPPHPVSETSSVTLSTTIHSSATKVVKIGKVRWPPVKEAESVKKDEVKVGKLFIEEEPDPVIPNRFTSPRASLMSPVTPAKLFSPLVIAPVPTPIKELVTANQTSSDKKEKPKDKKEKHKKPETSSVKLRMTDLEEKVKHLERRYSKTDDGTVLATVPQSPPVFEPDIPSPVTMAPPSPPPPPPPEVTILPKPVLDKSKQIRVVDVVDGPFEEVPVYEKLPLLEPSALDKIQSELFSSNNGPFYTYCRVPWQLTVKKEVFLPNEKMDNPLVQDLIFYQIVLDTYNNACIRINKDHRIKMKNMLQGHDISKTNMLTAHIKTHVKKNVIEQAKDWPLYFSRLYPVSGGHRLPDVTMISVNHTGVRLVKRNRELFDDHLKVIEHIRFEDVLEVSVPRGSTLQINHNGHWVILYTHRANQICSMINAFSIESEQGNSYVRAIKDYTTRESTLLSFKKGDLIRLTTKDMQLNQGWLFGTLNGKDGMFPIEYVITVSKKELHRLNIKTKDSAPHPPRDHPQPLSRSSSIRSVSTGEISPVTDGKYSMVNFATHYFRKSLNKYEMQRTSDGSIRGTLKMVDNVRKPLTGKTNGPENMVKWTKSPIQASLLNLASSESNKIALECFILIMKYMGDYPLKHQEAEIECVLQLLKFCHRNPEVRDEVYCQICKQTTFNRSTRQDGCLIGWRLLTIFTCWFECSETLRPHLITHIQNIALNPDKQYNAIANSCLLNLRKTLRYGGRKNVPSTQELQALTDGKVSKRQSIVLPGGTPMVLNIKPTSITADVIEEVCTGLGIDNPFEMEEYSVFYIIERERRFCPLGHEEYIFDVTTALENRQETYTLLFQRLSWFFPVHYSGSDVYIDLMYQQTFPDYHDGFLVILENNVLQYDHAAIIGLLTALRFRGDDKVHLPTGQEVKNLLPVNVANRNEIGLNQWVNLVHDKLKEIRTLDPLQCKAKFLETLSDWRLFGSTFFRVRKTYDQRIPGECLLAVNRDGVLFLDSETHSPIIVYNMSDILSARRGQSKNGINCLDIKCGNLMMQKIIRLETNQGTEIASLIGLYIQVMNVTRGQR